jgi:putative membrane protein
MKHSTWWVAGALALSVALPALADTKGSDARRLKRLAEANLAEIEAGKVASQKATSADVKKFAQQMVDDHGKQLREIRKLAQARNVELPAAPDAKHQRALEKLQALSGADFDRRYMRMQVADHRDARKLAERTAQSAADAELKAAAQKAAPAIQEHLKMAEDLAARSRAERRAASGASGGR